MAAVEHVVLDAGAFLRNADIKSIGGKAYTVQDVVAEIKDKATKRRLQVLPYELAFREPSADSISKVTDFAKKTGDYRSLSAVDIRVMALTYQLEKEFVGTDHMKTEPDKKVQWSTASSVLDRVTNTAGFYSRPSKKSIDSSNLTSPQPDSANADANTAVEDTQHATHKTDNPSSEQQGDGGDNGEETEDDNSGPDNTIEKLEDTQEGIVIADDDLEEESDEEEDESADDDEEEDDDDGWICPSNIKAVKERMGGEEMERTQVQVGCLTTDFAIQNVLIQMGLNVISVDGLLIKRATSYVLRCLACMKICSSLEKQFCPHCGNKTLRKVSMTVNEDGSIKYFLSKRRPINTRGTKFKLPAPVGGKHANNPRLFEDQPFPQNRVVKQARGKNNVFDPDYIANSSPFMINDVTSRAAQLGIRSHKGKQTDYWNRRNPNEVRKHGGRRK